MRVPRRSQRSSPRRAAVVNLYLFLAAAIIVIRLLRAAVHAFRWPTRSTTRRLR